MISSFSTTWTISKSNRNCPNWCIFCQLVCVPTTLQYKSSLTASRGSSRLAGLSRLRYSVSQNRRAP
jgi:hypothetical protein